MENMMASSAGPRLMSYREAQRVCGDLSESSLRRLIVAGRFPRPVILSRRKNGQPGRVAFVEAEVHAAVARMIAADREQAEQGAAA